MDVKEILVLVRFEFEDGEILVEEFTLSDVREISKFMEHIDDIRRHSGQRDN